jgi:hypothetical protein
LANEISSGLSLKSVKENHALILNFFIPYKKAKPKKRPGKWQMPGKPIFSGGYRTANKKDQYFLNSLQDALWIS